MIQWWTGDLHTHVSSLLFFYQKSSRPQATANAIPLINHSLFKLTQSPQGRKGYRLVEGDAAGRYMLEAAFS